MRRTTPILSSHLAYLKLHYLKEHFQSLADQAAREQWSPVQYLARLIEGEALGRQDRATQKRLKAARHSPVPGIVPIMPGAA
jgi:DNA replication protein DnaC